MSHAVSIGAACLSNDQYHATIDLSHLPSNLTRSPVRERVFRIDQNTSNYYSTPATDPAHANLQQVDAKTVKAGANYSETIDLAPNAIYLMLLEPQPGRR